jgi:hypothetical protein
MAVTIILPCAGEGKRLGLPFPKELAPIGPGRAVIDSCLDVIDKAPMVKRILLMDDGSRELTRQYIEKRLPDVPLAMTRQHPYAADMPEAVIRLAPWLDWTVNILMLPDVMYEPKGEPLTQLAALAEDTGFALAVAETPPDRLRAAGAVNVAGDRVSAYEDKPERPERFNASWGMIGFHGTIGMLGMRVVAGCTSKARGAREPVLGAPVVWLNEWRDVGVWDSYLRELGHAF